MLKTTEAFGAVLVALALTGLTACEATTPPAASAAKEAGSAKAASSAKAPGKDDRTAENDDTASARGATFAFMPRECKGGRFHANLSGLFANEGVTKNMGTMIETLVSDGDERSKAAFKVLQDGGLDLQTVTEVSGCLDEKNNPIIAVAHSGKVKDPLDLIANAVEAGGKPKPKKEEVDGVSYLTPEGQTGVVAAVSPTVLVVAENKEALQSVARGGDGAAEFTKAKDALVWLALTMAGEGGNVDATIKEKGDGYEGNFKIVLEGPRGEAFKKDSKKLIEDIMLEMEKGRAELEKSPFKAAAPILKSAKVSADGDALVVNVTVPKSALEELSKVAAERPQDLMRGL